MTDDSRDPRAPRHVDAEPLDGPFRIAEWRVEPALHRLDDGVREVRLEPRVTALLVYLATRAGTPVSRHELIDEVWSDVVVGDEALTMAISKLRRALGDDSRSPRFVETIAKSGYRLMVEVEPIENGASVPPSAESLDESPTPEARTSDAVRRRRALVGWALATAVLLVLYGVMSSNGPGIAPSEPLSDPASEPSPEPLPTTRLTSLPGAETQAEIAPDGRRVAYARMGSGVMDPGLFVLDLEGGGTRRLTDGIAATPVWSPDGREIAFTACDSEGCRLEIVAAEGGAPRSLGELARCPLVGIDWSPDGRSIAASLPSPTGCGLYEIDVESGARRLIEAPPEGQFDARPTYSPDGRELAFSRGEGALTHDLYSRPVEGGAPRAWTSESRRIWGFDWTADGEGLVFASNRGGRFQLWRLDAPGAEPTWIPVLAEDVRFPSITGSRLIFDQHEIGSEIWRVDTDGTARRVDWLRSRRRDVAPRVSPDGERVAFVSDRSGHFELWVAEVSSQPRRVSDLGASHMSGPAWSPNGRTLAVSTLVGKRQAVVLVSMATGAIRTLEADETLESTHPSWSADGLSIYFASRREAGTLWRMPVAGGEPVPVHPTGVMAQESADGTTLYFVRYDLRGLWRQPTAGGEASLVIDGTRFDPEADWQVHGEQVVFSRPAEDGEAHDLLRFDPATAVVEPFLALPGDVVTAGFSISPRDGSVLYSRRRDQESDLVLIENFR